MKRLSQVLAALVALCALSQVTVPAEWSVLTEAFTVSPVLAQECEWCGETPTGMGCMEGEPPPDSQAAGPFDECETVPGQGCGPECEGCDVGELCPGTLASLPGLAPSGVALYASARDVRVEDGFARTACGAWVVAVVPTGYGTAVDEPAAAESPLVLRL